MCICKKREAASLKENSPNISIIIKPECCTGAAVAAVGKVCEFPTQMTQL
jgi:hypothetical protein